MRPSESKTCRKILLNKEEGDIRNKWHKKNLVLYSTYHTRQATCI